MIQPAEVFEFESFEQSGEAACAEWTVPAGCAYLEGHFPGMPVLPGVGLLDGSLELLRRCGIQFPAGKLSLKKAKFTGKVEPGMRVKVSLVHKENRFDVEWRRQGTLEPLASFSFRTPLE
jgi:3-hydroxymyristoyl/3-hydroxydecanoyl-(acyl carrier protein) dehydratase